MQAEHESINTSRALKNIAERQPAIALAIFYMKITQF